MLFVFPIVTLETQELEALIRVLQSSHPGEVVDALKALEAVSHSSSMDILTNINILIIFILIYYN